MKSLKLFTLLLFSVLVMYNCSNDSISDQEQIVYLNNEPVALSSIDQTDDQLSILFVDDEDPLGRFFTDDDAMDKWLSLKVDGEAIKKSLDLEKKMKHYFIENDLQKLLNNPDKLQIAIEKFYDTSEQSKLLGLRKLKLYTRTGFNGTDKSYYGPVLVPFLGEGLDNNFESFKAWSSTISGILTLYDGTYWNGASRTFWVPYYAKSANLEEFNNLTSSLTYIGI